MKGSFFSRIVYPEVKLFRRGFLEVCYSEAKMVGQRKLYGCGPSWKGALDTMEELGDEAQPHVSGSLLPRQVTVNDSRTSQHQLLTEVRNESTHRIARTGHHSGCRSPAGCLAFRGLCCLLVPGCSSQTHTPLETETASGFEANRWLILLI